MPPKRTAVTASATKAKKFSVTASALKKGKGKAPSQIKLGLRDDLKDAAAQDGVVQVLDFSDAQVTGHVRRKISTQGLAWDRATGVGGLPCGRLVEVYGDPDTGKSTFCAHVLGETQRLGGVAFVVDAEEVMDLTYVRNMGVNVDQLLMIQPLVKTFESVIEAILRILERLCGRSDRFDFPITIVWDSVGGTPTMSEMTTSVSGGKLDADEDEEGKGAKGQIPGRAAKLLSETMRKLIGKLARSGALLLVVNQQYHKIGAFGHGPKKATYGGKAIRYHASMRLETIRMGMLKDTAGSIIGMEGKIQPFKNKLSGYMGSEPFAIVRGEGVSNAWSLQEKLSKHRYIVSGGGWYTTNIAGEPQRRYQGGFRGLQLLLSQDPGLYQKFVDIYNALP